MTRMIAEAAQKYGMVVRDKSGSIALYGEDAAFDYLRRLAPNVIRYTQSGTAQGPSVARGEVGVGVTFVHEFVSQQLQGFPV